MCDPVIGAPLIAWIGTVGAAAGTTAAVGGTAAAALAGGTAAVTSAGAGIGALGAFAGAAGTTAAAGMTAAEMGMLALSAGSAIAGAGSAYQQAEAQKQAATYNAQVADVNAQNARAEGEFRAQQVQRQGQQTLGAQRAVMAARGLDLSTGTAGELQDQTLFFSNLDAEQARLNAKNAANGYYSQGEMQRQSARSISPGTNAALSLIGTGSTIANSWYQRSAQSAYYNRGGA